MSSATVKALNPKGYFNDVLQAALSPRLDTLDGKTLYIVESWPGNSGFEEMMELLDTYLMGKYKDLKIEHRKRLLYSSDDPALWKEMYEKADAFVYFAAPSCSTTACAVTWPARALERNGLPGLTVIYSYLEPDALISREREGMEIRLAKVPYPYQDIPQEEKDAIVRNIEAALFDALTEKELEAGWRTPEQPERYLPEATEDELQDYFHNNGMTDGLPVIIPTEERVEAMLKGTSHPRDEVVVNLMAPEGRKVTVEKVAINAVMAGAEPCYMPVLLAAIEIVGRDEGFHQTAKSTNAFSFMQVVNGPIRKEINMNDSVYALGAGNRANAVIGRFLRLAMINLGGSEPGVNLMGVQGNVTSYTFAFAENEESSPWASFSSKYGYGKDESVLSIFTGGWAHCGNYMLRPNGVEEMARSITEFELVHGFTVLIAPRRAEELVKEGCKTLEDVEDYMWRKVALPIGEMKARGRFGHILRDMETGDYDWPKEYLTEGDDAVVPIYPRKGVSIVVVGDPQGSNVMQGWSMYSPKTTSIDKWR